MLPSAMQGDWVLRINPKTKQKKLAKERKHVHNNTKNCICLQGKTTVERILGKKRRNKYLEKRGGIYPNI